MSGLRYRIILNPFQNCSELFVITNNLMLLGVVDYVLLRALPLRVVDGNTFTDSVLDSRRVRVSVRGVTLVRLNYRRESVRKGLSAYFFGVCCFQICG